MRRSPIRAAALVIALVVAGCSGPTWLGQPPSFFSPTPRSKFPFESPFNVAERRAIAGQFAQRMVCATPPPVLRNLRSESAQKTSAIATGTAEDAAAQDNALQTLRDYVRRTGEMADVYVRSQPADSGAAICALDWMDAWAFNEGLLGEVSRPLGAAALDRAVVGLAIAYLKLRDEPALAAEKKDLVEAWLAAIVTPSGARPVPARGAEPTDEGVYWSALASMAAGVAAGERAPFDSGVAIVRRALAEVRSDGTLAWALRRGPDGLHAHAAAMTPLVMAAELAAANGVDLYGERDGALQLVARRVIEGLDDAGYFARAAGAAQSPADSLGPAELAWMEPYYARFQDAKLPRWIARNRPLKNPDLGGDMTLAFGVRNFFAAR